MGSFLFDLEGMVEREGANLTLEIDPATKQIAGYSFNKVTLNNEFQPRPGLSGCLFKIMKS